MTLVLKDTLASLQDELANLSIQETLSKVTQYFPDKVTFSTSFSYEDQVITDLLQQNRVPVSIFTLDTGRLFPETYSVWSRTNEQYGIKIQAYYPEAVAAERFVNEYGPNAFYESLDRRKECCFIRKVAPLQKALGNKAVWITGLRAEHSAVRQHISSFQWDEGNGIIKYNPLLHWTTEEVKSYIQQHSVPYNALHDKGFISIGCAPCTRAIREGEDFRAGRWWWEDSSKKECGLHVPTAIVQPKEIQEQLA